MQSQKQLRDELRFVTEFTTLFDVVQQTAATQLRHFDEQVGRQPALVERLRKEFFPLLPPEAKQHIDVRGGTEGRLLVVLTSDEGLVGPLHTAVVHEAQQRAETGTQWLFIGQRGWRIAGSGIGRAHVVPIPPEGRIDEQMVRIRQFVVTQYRAQRLKDVWLIAPRYVSTTHQDIVAEQLLPLPAGVSRADDTRLVIEPSVHRVVERLTEAWVEVVCRERLWSCRRAECAARALHIEVSRQELNRRARVVRHAFFKTMHERLDEMVRETCVVQRHAARRRTRWRQLTAAV